MESHLGQMVLPFLGGDIGQILLESLNEAFQKRELSITQKI